MQTYVEQVLGLDSQRIDGDKIKTVLESMVADYEQFLKWGSPDYKAWEILVYRMDSIKRSIFHELKKRAEE